MPKEAIETQQPQQMPELPPAFVHVRDQFREARKTLLKDPAFAQPQQLRQFIAQFVLPIMENATTLFGSAFVDTYALAAAGHEEIARIHQAIGGQEGGEGFEIDLDDLNDLQKAFYTLGTVIGSKGDPETKAAYEVCAKALTAFVALVVEDARDAEGGGGEPEGEPVDETDGFDPTEEV